MINFMVELYIHSKKVHFYSTSSFGLYPRRKELWFHNKILKTSTLIIRFSSSAIPQCLALITCLTRCDGVFTVYGPQSRYPRYSNVSRSWSFNSKRTQLCSLNIA